MERVAVISDVHGNLTALQAILQDIEKRKIHHIYCLGDTIGKGAHPLECLTLIKEKCEIVLQGNCDEYFSKTYPQEMLNERIQWNQHLVPQQWREYLLALPSYYDLYMSGRCIRFFHATPWSNHDFIVSASRLEEKLKMFQKGELVDVDEMADIVCYGHTHTPYFDKLFHRSLINVGSVGNGLEIFQKEGWNGQPFESVDATYFVLEGDVQSREWGSLSYQWVKVPYDISKELADDVQILEREAYMLELEKGYYRDMAKLKK